MLAKSIMIAFVALWGFGLFATIGNIGKPRKPISNRLAGTVAFVTLLDCVAALYVYNQL